MASPGIEEGGTQAGGGQGGKQEVAEASRARATPLFVLLAEEEEDKGEEVGWAGQMGWPAGPVLVGCTVRPGKLGFSLSLSLLFTVFYFCSVFLLFNLFCHCFEFKNNSTMPKLL